MASLLLGGLLEHLRYVCNDCKRGGAGQKLVKSGGGSERVDSGRLSSDDGDVPDFPGLPLVQSVVL